MWATFVRCFREAEAKRRISYFSDEERRRNLPLRLSALTIVIECETRTRSVNHFLYRCICENTIALVHFPFCVLHYFGYGTGKRQFR